jgi:hypothetical protein
VIGWFPRWFACSSVCFFVVVFVVFIGCDRGRWYDWRRCTRSRVPMQLSSADESFPWTGKPPLIHLRALPVRERCRALWLLWCRVVSCGDVRVEY